VINHVGANRPLDLSVSPQTSGKHAKSRPSQDWLDLLAEAQSSAKPSASTTGTSATYGRPDSGREIVMDLIVANEHDDRRLITLPWRLIANDGIEQRGRGDAPALSQMPAAIVPGEGGAARAQTAVSAGPHLPATTATLEADSCFPDRTPERPRIYQQPSHDAEHRTDETRSGGASGHVVQAWAERLVRLLGDGNGEISIWVRDYALRGQDERKVVDAIRDFCAKQGVRVEKIAINGHVLWSSAAAATARENV
jgi:hypothetical protein